MNYKDALNKEAKSVSSFSLDSTDQTSNVVKTYPIYVDIFKDLKRQNDNVSSHHKKLLSIISSEFGASVEFLDINNKKIDLNHYPSTEVMHKKTFASEIFYFKSASMFRIGHYIKSDISLADIRGNKNVVQLLKNTILD